MATPDVAAVKAQIKAEFPAFKVKHKGDSALMKLLKPFMTKTFMTSFTTTIWHTVYVPDSFDSWPAASQCAVLRHERVHMRQARKLTFPVFACLYLFVFFPVGLAWCRTRFEQEAYEESLAAYKDYGFDYSSPILKARMVAHFTTGEYGWMWLFPKSIESWFDGAVARLQ